MTSRVEQLRSEMTAALAEAEAQEAYEAEHAAHLASPDDADQKERRREAAENLRATRARLRTERGSGPIEGAVTPAPIVATATVKEVN
jgi:hypothetical protein